MDSFKKDIKIEHFPNDLQLLQGELVIKSSADVNCKSLDLQSPTIPLHNIVRPIALKMKANYLVPSSFPSTSASHENVSRNVCGDDQTLDNPMLVKECYEQTQRNYDTS